MPDEQRGSDQQRKLSVDCPIKVCGTAIPSPFSYSPHCYISPAVQIYKGSWAGKTKHKVGSRNKQGPALEFDQVEIWPQCVAQNSWLWFFRPHTIWHPEFKHLQHGFGLQKCRIYVLCEKKKTHSVLGRLTNPSHYTRKVSLEEWGLKDELLVIWWIDFLDISYNNKLEKEGKKKEEGRKRKLWRRCLVGIARLLGMASGGVWNESDEQPTCDQPTLNTAQTLVFCCCLLFRSFQCFVFLLKLFCKPIAEKVGLSLAKNHIQWKNNEHYD